MILSNIVIIILMIYRGMKFLVSPIPILLWTLVFTSNKCAVIQPLSFIFVVHRFSPFVKVGAESYVLGHAVKKAPRIAEAEKIRIVVSNDQLANKLCVVV